MVKRVRSDSGPLSLQKHNHWCVKLGVSIFLVGLVVRLLLWDSFSFSSVVVETPPPLEDAKALSPVFSSSVLQDSDEFPENDQKIQTQISKNGKGILLSCSD